MSYNAVAPSLNVLVGVLAISLEQYVEAMRWLIQVIENGLSRLFGVHH
jgi:hypothetical protein